MVAFAAMAAFVWTALSAGIAHADGASARAGQTSSAGEVAAGGSLAGRTSISGTTSGLADRAAVKVGATSGAVDTTAAAANRSALARTGWLAIAAKANSTAVVNETAKMSDSSNSQTGTFTVSATNSGTDASSKSFVFIFKCTDGKSGQLKVRGDGKPVGAGKRLPVGSQCTVAEKPASAKMTGFDLVAPEPQTVAISAPGEVVALTFVNHYVARTGSFEVTSANAANDGVVLPSNIEVRYACSNGSSGTLVVPGDQTAVKGPVLPTGTTCGLVGDLDRAQMPGYSLKEKEFASTVTIRTGTSQLVSITKHYVRLSGQFSVRVNADASGATRTGGQRFLVDYECTDGSSGTLEIPGDGSSVSSPSLHVGTVCDIAEHNAARRGARPTPAINVDRPSVTISESSTQPVTLTPTHSASAAQEESQPAAQPAAQQAPTRAAEPTAAPEPQDKATSTPAPSTEPTRGVEPEDSREAK